MAIPVNASVILPDDASNTGKKMRTISRVVGGQTVHEHYFVPSKGRNSTGYYMGHTGICALQQTVMTFGTTQFFMFTMPTAATVAAAIRKIKVHSAGTTARVYILATRMMWSNFTFSGTPSGGATTCSRLDSTFPAPQLEARVALNGCTQSKIADLWGPIAIASATVVGYYAPTDNELSMAEDENTQLIIRPGEGIGFWQADGGLASDDRKANATVMWEEFSLS